MRRDSDGIVDYAVNIAVKAAGLGGNKLVDILNPDGVPEFHNIDHMVTVARNAVELAAFYELPFRTRIELAIAGLFHDAGRLNIPDNENIDRAKSIVRQTLSRIPTSSIDRIGEYISATEFSDDNDDRIIAGGRCELKIMRDSDYLVWTSPSRAMLYDALTAESGKTVTEQTTREFLYSRGCLLERSRELFAMHGFDVPVKGSIS